MRFDLAIFLWLLKLGALINLLFLVNTFALPSSRVDADVLIPARLFFAVSAYRCLFPVQYQDRVVFHDSPFSSIFLTRLLATFSEIAFISLLAYTLRLLNTNSVAWLNRLSWSMVLQVMVCQFFVWGAVLTGRRILFYYEELGWFNLFAVNTIASAYLCVTANRLGGAGLLLGLNVLFGFLYLPWQLLHLRTLRAAAGQARLREGQATPINGSLLKAGLWRSIRVRQQTTDASPWGGLLGVTWMTGYWATLIPLWVNQIVVVLAR
jgi:hypothetical protein